MKTKISIILLLTLTAMLLSNCMVIADLIEENQQPKAEPTTASTDKPAEASNPQQSAPAADTPPYLDFPITLLDGNTTTLRDHQGKSVLMVFFSVNCGHCHNEASHLEAVYQDYKDQGFVIIASEVSGADIETIQDFAEDYGITFPIGFEPEFLFAREMEVTGVPHNVLFGTHGEIATIMRGFSDVDSLRSSIELFLGN